MAREKTCIEPNVKIRKTNGNEREFDYRGLDWRIILTKDGKPSVIIPGGSDRGGHSVHATCNRRDDSETWKIAPPDPRGGVYAKIFFPVTLAGVCDIMLSIMTTRTLFDGNQVAAPSWRTTGQGIREEGEYGEEGVDYIHRLGHPLPDSN